jgi:hypothetical protein
MKKLLIALMLLAAMTQHAFADDINYVSLTGDKRSPIGFSDDAIRFADVDHPLQHCAPDDDYVCVMGHGFTFPIPRKERTLSTWTHNGAVYNAYDRKEIMLFGKLIRYRIIHQRWQHQTFEYMYSDEYGIVSIADNKKNMLVMSDACGVVAIDDTYGCVYKRPVGSK